MKEELLNVKGATKTVLLYRLELLAHCPMPSHLLFSALTIIITLTTPIITTTTINIIKSKKFSPGEQL